MIAVMSLHLPDDRVIDLDRPVLFGVLNVTPDSFSDGGAYPDVDAAVLAARRMLDEGADAIDIGGESTRPGAPRVPADEQLRRVLPVIERLVDELDRQWIVWLDGTHLPQDITLAPEAEGITMLH